MDNLEWEEWMALSDEQQEVILDREQRALTRITDAMPRPALFARYRQSFLESCLQRRRFAREFPFMRTYLRQSQISLLRLRAWRATGYTQYPGEA